MAHISEAVDRIAGQLGLTADEIDKRKRFLEFSEQDIALLRDLRSLLGEQKDGFSTAFYEHLFNFPELQTLLPDPTTIGRLRQSQAAYFDRLTAGDYGPAYVHDRLRVGVVHQKIGLGPKWYIGAYRKYLSEIMRRLWPLLSARPDRFLDTCDAVLKIVCLDMVLALDTYFAADQQLVLQQRDYLEQIIAGMPAGLVVVDSAGLIRSVNATMLAVLELDDDAHVRGRPIGELVPDPGLLSGIAAVKDNAGPVDNLLVTLGCPDCAERKLEVNIRLTAQGGENLLLLIATDVTPRLRAAMRLRESEEHFRLIFTQAGLGIAYSSASGKLMRVNPKLCEILGYPESELLSRRFHDFTYHEDLESSAALAARLVSGEIREFNKEKRYVHKDGHPVWVNVTVSAIVDSEGKNRYLAVIEDISARKQAEEDLVRVANFDRLTRLPNRNLMQEKLAAAIVRAEDTGRRTAVVLIDLDRFRKINDSLGHDIGDQVLLEVARRLTDMLPGSAALGRLGEDEFVIIAEFDSREEVDALVSRIIDGLRAPLHLPACEVFPSVSVGVSLYPDDGRDSGSLLKNADTAMHRAKQAGGGIHRYYTADMNARALDNLKLEAALRRALERDEFVLHYQPQVCMPSGRLAGVEALIRWQPAGQRMVSPAEFIPIAEDTGLIAPIGAWILRAACRQYQSWLAAGLDVARIHVNLSARQFRQHDLVSQVRQALQETGCPPGALGLEITESMVMDNPDGAVRVMHELSAMGIHLAIDDFGTGYSSLSYLKRFPINCLKIDRSFVRDIAADNDDAMIVSAVVALARSLKLEVVAEGVEERGQAEFLRDQGCGIMQGYFFSRPLPADQLRSFVEEAASA
ncbi:EAL domain-containing protein [Noviherbaspirillum aridicola]|uniref:Diguanylate cyclase DosC n=1 Tax=Noviherbaspirillum aridicola TaxID=2849687 RepID=A0ABQ4PZZ7_9BURK|nr:EAL domain-containing protein [Noviherbaspirillum aridicola]GIZ50398.1 hypothetical protein NCCP691_04120 [Noviherbaspirillum aridicola]